METHLAVIDNRLFTLVDKLYRILNRKDVFFAVDVRLMDNGRQGGRLTTPCGPRHQNEPSRQGSQSLDHLRKHQLITGQNLGRNLPENGPHAIFLLEEVGAIAGKTWDLIGKVNIPGFLKFFDLVLRGNLIEHGFQGIIFKRRILYPLQFAANSQNRLLS